MDRRSKYRTENGLRKISILGSSLKDCIRCSDKDIVTHQPRRFYKMKHFVQSFLKLTSTSAAIQLQSVRYRYHAEKIAKGKLLRRFGYEEKLLERGTLPHVDGTRLPIPLYRPKDMWNSRRALFGQNDYIDILGNDSLHPTRILYNVPAWLRGFKGNEYQHCLRKKIMLRHGSQNYEMPLKWYNLNRRIKYLYKYLNTKTKTGYTDKSSG